MPMLLLLLVQATTPEPVDGTQAARPLVAAKRCVEQPDEDGEIVVCGHVDQEQFRVRPLPDRYHPNTGPGVGFMLGDVAGNVYAQQGGTIDGKTAPRLMVTLRKPF